MALIRISYVDLINNVNSIFVQIESFLKEIYYKPLVSRHGKNFAGGELFVVPFHMGFLLLL
ncbi:hypothetical protein CAP36_07945 [Chitinophagaceae bacterium IBVUCB2]|nr:hypothetical protein CAP36_07945 [Chitinophagaceae bacterium IBVUCB2]